MNKSDGLDIINNYKGSGIKENLFYCMYLKTNGLYDILEKKIDDIVSYIDVDDIDNYKSGIMLYLLSELAYYAGGSEKLGKYDAIIKRLIEKSMDYKSSTKNIINGKAQVNTASLGAVYSGLKNINNYLKIDEVSKRVKEIRNFVFAENLNGAVLSNGNVYKEITFDILLACVPFGLFEPEDLVLVESVKQMKLKGISSNSKFENLLMAMYLAEQGSINMAKEYLKAAAANGLGDIINASLYQIIYKTLEERKCLDEYMISHNPEGNNNIYVPAANERIPKLIKEKDVVAVRAVTWPNNETIKPMLKYCRNKVEHIVNGKYVTESGGYYEWEIGPFGAGEEIEYEFFFAVDNRQIKSPKYKFDVLKKIELTEIKEIGKNGSGIKISYAGEIPLYVNIGESGDVNISVNKYKENSVPLEFTIEKSEGIFIYGANNSLVIKDGTIQDKRGSVNIKKIAVYIDKENKPQIFDVVLHNRAAEKFYGFGERFNALNQRGNTPDAFVYNQYKDQGLRTYIPVSFFISSENYGVFVDSANYKKFDMGEKRDEESVIAEYSQTLDIHFMSGAPAEVIKKYTDITGKPKMVPKWVLGPWMSSNNWDSQNEVMRQLELTKKHKIPSTVLVIEQWSDEATYYIFNDADYDGKNSGESYTYGDYKASGWGRWPNPKEIVERLHEEGIKCILWQIPVLKKMFGVRHLQNQRDMDYAVKMEYVVKNKDGTPYRIPEGWFMGSLVIDFSNKEASEWWFEKRKYLIDEIGIDGFKTDGGECIFGNELMFADGRTGAEMRNSYPNDYIKAYYEFLTKDNPLKGITFSRAGYNGAQNSPAHWAGDERSTFEAFRRTLYAGLSAGLSGIPFWGWDLGGFSGEIPSAELFIRSTQFAAFCPIMQYHAESKAEFNQDRTPWNIAERRNAPEVIDIYRDYANLRMNMLPYIYNESLYSAKSGEPVMRAMFLDYFDDADTHLLDDQYMFGRDILTAPIIEEGSRGRDVYLPNGKWQDFFTGSVIEGGRYIEAAAGIGQIPVFVKENSIIPLNLGDSFELSSDVTNSIENYKNLVFLLNGDKAGLMFSDDMGNSFTINAVKTEGRLRITYETNYKKEFYILTKEEGITINGKKYEGIKTKENYLYKLEGK